MLQFARDYKNLKFREWENAGSPEHFPTGDLEAPYASFWKPLRAETTQTSAVAMENIAIS